MADTTTFFAQISRFFCAFWAYVLRVFSSSTTPSDDLEIGIPSGSVNPWVSSRFSTAMSVISGSSSVDRFVSINLNSGGKIKEAISIASHIIPAKASVSGMGHICHCQPTVKNDQIVPASFPANPINIQFQADDSRSKHRSIQLGPSSVHKLPEGYPKSKPRRHRDSISDLLDQFPAPPTYIPLPPPVISRDAVPQTVEKTTLTPAENCPSPTISEQSTISSSSGSNSISSTNPSISISNDTANTSVHEFLESVPCTSAVSKVLSSGIDVKDKDIARLTLIHYPETLVLPATCVRGRTRSQSLFTPEPKTLPETYHDVVDSPKQADLQKGDISKDTLSKERERVDTPAFISEDLISRGTKHEADLQSRLVEHSLAPIHNLENSSQRLDKHAPVLAPVKVVPAVPTKSTRPYVAPLRIVKKNKVQTVGAPVQVVLAVPMESTRPSVAPLRNVKKNKVQPVGAPVQVVPVVPMESTRPSVAPLRIVKKNKVQSIGTPIQVVPAVPTKSIKPFVAPLRIVKKNKAQPIVIPLEPPVTRRADSRHWELAMDQVLRVFRDVETEDRDFRDLFYGDSSFVSQSSVVESLGDGRGDLDGRDEYDGDCERRPEDSFYNNDKSANEDLSMHIAPPDLVSGPKVEDLASVSLSSEPAVAQRIMEVKDDVKNVDLPVLRLRDCDEGYEDSYSWTAATDDDDDDDEYYSSEEDQWNDRSELKVEG